MVLTLEGRPYLGAQWDTFHLRIPQTLTGQPLCARQAAMHLGTSVSETDETPASQRFSPVLSRTMPFPIAHVEILCCTVTLAELITLLNYLQSFVINITLLESTWM